MKHHNKHFIGALSVIVLVMILTGMLLSSQNLIGFDVTGMAVVSVNFPPNGIDLNSKVTPNVIIKVYATSVPFTVTKDDKTTQTINGQVLVMIPVYQKPNEYQVAAYNFVKDANGVVYLANKEGEQTNVYSLTGTGEVFVEEKNENIGVLIPISNEGSLLYTDIIDAIITSSGSYNYGMITNAISPNNNLVTQKAYEKIKHEQDIEQLSSELGISKTAINAEQTAVQTYLDSSSYKGVTYDVVTGKYSGTVDGTKMEWSKDGTLYVQPKGQTYYIKEVEKKKGKTEYYKCDSIDKCSDTPVSGNDINTIEEQYKNGEEKLKKVEETVQDARNSKDLPQSVRQQSYMNKLYAQQEQKFKGLVTGYLSKWIDKWLGGWSRGMPAGICKYIFGLEYYKNAGFMAMPGNTSATQLQSTIISHSNTIIIEGEKEEITGTLYRYAYTIRLLSNQSTEWTTYLYNSCSQENSQEQFYDYGALGAGDYYAFHYAGAGEQDMIFDCTIEQCLYDQACVALSDGSAPVCVSLANGVGFETPTAGSDYDCAIS